MAETTRREWRQTRTRYTTPADAAIARTSGAPFWILAALLLVGLGLGTYVAYQGLNGPGVFTPEQADVAVGWAMAATTVVLLLFLVMIAAVFGQVRRLHHVGEEREVRRKEETTRQTEVNDRLNAEITLLRQREHMLRRELAQRRVIPSLDEDEPHVLLLQGVGPKYAARLNQIGIITVGQLRQADAANVASRIDAMPELVREWQAMAELMDVRGIGPQWAEALVRVGVTSTADLAGRDPNRLAHDIAALNQGANRVTGTDPSAATCARWVRSARSAGRPRARPGSGTAKHARAPRAVYAGQGYHEAPVER